jgi:F-type H+-transporting ATPase subunit alpha
VNSAAPDDWLAQSRAALARTRFTPHTELVGRVEHVADSVASVSGLPDVRINELLRFEGGRMGFALALDEDLIRAVLLDEAEAIEAGSRVSATGEMVDVPVGPALLGRVVDPLGRPLDRDEPLVTAERSPVERAAPAIIDRDLVTEPVATGILLIDSLFAIGRGQRELIIGDRATGKTSIAVDTIVNQKYSDLISVYVAIGQRATAVQRVIDAVRRHGAIERCVFVVASSAASAGLQWIAPFSGFTIAEYFRDRGQHALVVIDDLTKHAATHRELALLTREPPGREAYPGDVFYLHARLLERAAKLAPELGGGSLTALPIAQTEGGNLSAYIPTNLISITDGQVVLNTGLFAANQRPAVDVGLSVSRVGGKAQLALLRSVAGRLRLDYAQFLELEVFTRFGGLTDARVRKQLLRGERIRALFAQPRFAPLRTIDMVALLAALNEGVFDALPVQRITEVRERLPASLDTEFDATGFPCPETTAREHPISIPALLAALVAAVQVVVSGACGPAS